MLSIKLSRRFFKDLKKLRKKFYKIEEDLDALFSLLRKGSIVGNMIRDLGDLEIYKARVRNISGDSGKSGGFRVIYYVKIKNDDESDIVALAIYSKSQRTNISKKEIVEILENENLI